MLSHDKGEVERHTSENNSCFLVIVIIGLKIFSDRFSDFVLIKLKQSYEIHFINYLEKNNLVIFHYFLVTFIKKLFEHIVGSF